MGNCILGGSTTLNLNSGLLNLASYTLRISGTLNVGAEGKLQLGANSRLELLSGSSLNLLTGGELYAVGSSGNSATITSPNGYYSFTAGSSTTIGARYCVFEKIMPMGSPSVPAPQSIRCTASATVCSRTGVGRHSVAQIEQSETSPSPGPASPPTPGEALTTCITPIPLAASLSRMPPALLRERLMKAISTIVYSGAFPAPSIHRKTSASLSRAGIQCWFGTRLPVPLPTVFIAVRSPTFQTGEAP